LKIWRFTKFVAVATVTSIQLLVTSSSATNPVPRTPIVTVSSTTLPNTAATLAFSPIGSVAGTPATATAVPPTPNEKSVHFFDYDRTVPLDIQKISVEDHNGVAVHDITYGAYSPQYGFPIKGRMSAYLAKPSGTRPFAGVVFMHWLGETNGDRSEFLEEAVMLANKGVVSLLIEGLFPWHVSPSSYEADRVQVINQVIELRRALDVLLSQPEVDPQRIGYVGHDYGAMFGGILAGVDKRVKAYVLMAGMGNFGDWSLTYWPVTGSKSRKEYRDAMADVDPIGYIKYAAPAALFFQFAQNDFYISEEVAKQFYDAGSNPKQVEWYNT